jgi:hypothetical protein
MARVSPISPLSIPDPADRSALALPESWGSWPLSIEVQFHLTEANAVSSDDYPKFSASGLEEAAAKFFAVEHDYWYFPGYRLHTEGVAAISYWVDWPLLRKVGAPSVQRGDGPRRDAIGLEYGAEDTLLYLWKRPKDPLGFRGQLRLCTAGRSLHEAIAAYDLVAPQLRQLRKRMRVSAMGRRGEQ